MSDDIIKVLDLPGIAEYSQSINKFSKSLSTATNDTARTFNIQIEGSEGEAINAFLQSLNDLQGKIFNQIPEVLKKYATVVSDFESSVSGVGFTNEAWTSGTGNTSVQNKLTGSQKETLQSVAKTLQSALDTATDALGESTIDLSVITNTTSSSLDDASKERLNTHTPFQSAHDTFSQNLQQVLESITTLKGSVGQAQITLNLSPKAVFNMLAQGLHMNPLDTINNIDEAKVLVTGYGYCGKAIAKRLGALGARVTVLARRKEARKEAKGDGFYAVDFAFGPEEAMGAAMVVNTVPALVVTEKIIRELPRDAYIVDIASGEGGTDFACAREYGIHADHVLGIPGKYAPKESAYILERSVERFILKEKQGEMSDGF